MYFNNLEKKRREQINLMESNSAVLTTLSEGSPNLYYDYL
nr:MAG TPA: hypothetical protein [Caudoviricetes sp.]